MKSRQLLIPLAIVLIRCGNGVGGAPATSGDSEIPSDDAASTEPSDDTPTQSTDDTPTNEPTSDSIIGTFVGDLDTTDADAIADFNSRFDRFAEVIGAPRFMNASIDYTLAFADWPGEAKKTAAAWAANERTKTLIPVIAIPMARDPSHDQSQLDSIAAGELDDIWSGIAVAWRDHGFTTIYAAIGPEMDRRSMPWWYGDTTEYATSWIQAFTQIAAVLHGIEGVTAKTVFCPAPLKWGAVRVANVYPGSDAVDVVAMDVFSEIDVSTSSDWHPNDLYDFAAADGSDAPDFATWVSKPGNRTHAWDYTSATRYHQTGKVDGWEWQRAIQYASDWGKPLALRATGVGGPKAQAVGVWDDAEFPKWLAGTVDAHPLEFVMIWDAKADNGDWSFSDGSKPEALAAWKTYFAGKY